MRSCSDTDINPLSLYSRERGKKKIVILWYDIFCLFDEALFSKLQTRSWRQSIETNKIMRKKTSIPFTCSSSVNLLTIGGHKR